MLAGKWHWKQLLKTFLYHSGASDDYLADVDLPPSSSGSDADSAAEEGDQEHEQQSSAAGTSSNDTREIRGLVAASGNIAETAARNEQQSEDLSECLQRASLSVQNPSATINC